jgi:hypothetical protein
VVLSTFSQEKKEMNPNFESSIYENNGGKEKKL